MYNNNREQDFLAQLFQKTIRKEEITAIIIAIIPLLRITLLRFAYLAYNDQGIQVSWSTKVYSHKLKFDKKYI